MTTQLFQYWPDSLTILVIFKATTVFLCKCTDVYEAILKYINFTEDEKETATQQTLRFPYPAYWKWLC